jgi:hypothetical protein
LGGQESEGADDCEGGVHGTRGRNQAQLRVIWRSYYGAVEVMPFCFESKE